MKNKLCLLLFISVICFDGLAYTPANVQWTQDTIRVCVNEPLVAYGELLPAVDFGLDFFVAQNVRVSGNLPHELSFQQSHDSVTISGVLRQPGVYTLNLISETWLSLWETDFYDPMGMTYWDETLFTDTCVNTLTIIVNPLPIVAFQQNNASCGQSDGQLTALPSGGLPPYQFSWQGFSDTTSTLSSIASGIYHLWVQDKGGCSVNKTVALSNKWGPSALSQVSNPTCVTKQDGSIKLTGLNGLSPFSFSWSTGAQTDSISGLSAGDYSVMVKEASTCSTAYNFSLNYISPPLYGTLTTQKSCSGGTNGSITANVTGGTMPYTFSWSNGATTPNLTGIGQGNYQLYLTDINGCKDTVTASTYQTPLTVSRQTIASFSPIDCFEGLSTYERELWTVSGDTPPYHINSGAPFYSSQDVLFVDGVYYTKTVNSSIGCSLTVLNNVQVVPPVVFIPAYGAYINLDTLILSVPCNQPSQFSISGVAHSWVYTQQAGDCDTNFDDYIEKHKLSGSATAFQVCCNSYFVGTGCSGVDCDTLYWSGVGIENGTEGSPLLVYPNPFKSETEVFLPPQAGGSQIKITVSDMLGKEIQGIDVPYFEEKYTIKLDTAPQGIYVLRVFSNQHLIGQEKLIKN